MRIVGAAVIVAVLCLTPAHAQQALPLATMTCKQFLASPKDAIGVILTWLTGYTHDHDEPATIDFTRMEDLGKKLGAYCAANPSHGLMTAVEKVTE